MIKKIFIGVLCLAGVAYLLGIGLIVLRTQQVQGPITGDVNGIPFMNVATSGATTVTSSSVQVLATSSEAQYRMFQNNSPVGIWLSFKNDKAAAINNGVYLQASSTLELRNESLYLGAVTAITSGGSATLLITQK